MPIDTPFVSPILVGRAAELQDQFGAARNGAGRTVVLLGEAGAGKTRLVSELAPWARRQGAAVCTGQCFEPDGTAPYGLIRDLVHKVLKERDDTAGNDEFRRHVADLSPIVPEISHFLPDLGSPRTDDRPYDWRRVAHAVIGLLAQVARSGPAIVVLEDLHWSDEASLQCVLHLSRAVASMPVLLVLTCRDDGISPVLGSALAELNRSREVTEIRIAPLVRDEVGAMVGAMFVLHRPPRPLFVNAIFELSGGNPLFIEEIMAALVAGGDIFRVGNTWERRQFNRLRIPRSVNDAVQRRMADLPDSARNVLVLAAVIGQRIDIDLLVEVSGMAEEDLLSQLGKLADANLLVEGNSSVLMFRHALTRQAVESGVLSRERLALHRRVAEGLQRLGENDPGRYLDELSHHLVAAEWWEQAFDASIQAGIRSVALGGPHAAIAHFDRAEEAASHLEIEMTVGALSDRARAYETIGEFDAARADLERGLNLAKTSLLSADIWRMCLALGLLWSSRDYDVAYSYFDRALTVARHAGDERMYAHSLNRMGNWLANRNQCDLALTYHREALEIFVRFEDRPGEAATLDLKSMAASLSGDMLSAAGHSAQALAIFRELGDRAGQAGSFGVAAPNAIYDLNVLVGVGTLVEMTEHFESSVTLARKGGWGAGEAMALAMLGEGWGAIGDYGKSLSALERALGIAEEIEHQPWTVQALWGLGGLHADFLDLPASRVCLERALGVARAIHSTLWTSAVAGQLACVLTVTGELEEATAVLDSLLEPDTPMQGQAERHLWNGKVELLLATNHASQALDVVDRMYAASKNLTSEGDIPRLALMKARALAKLGDPVAAETLLSSTLKTARDQGAGPVTLRLYTALARLGQSTTSLPAAIPVDNARSLISRMANSIPAGERRDAYVHAASGLLPRTARFQPGSAPSRPGGLTRREREVARLLISGLSNREIGERLFIGERTAEAHVSGIMRKLGFASRAQAAAWAVVNLANGGDSGT